ncbi:MAG: hypothetical protein IPL21_16980 [Saprospirales bacterium]|nr:hypothetical protein [Saprospirales bacterium]
MKTKTKKIAQYSAIALAAAAVLPMACKKETKEADDPNIIHRDLNKTLTLSSTTKIDSIDVNLDGINELVFIGVSIGSSDITYLLANPGQGLIFCDTTSVSSLKLANASDAGFTPLALPSPQWNQYSVLDVNVVSPSLIKGAAGKGDKYVSFVFKNGLKPFYGWLRVNVSADHKTVLIKDLAYSVLPETLVKTGSK